MVFCLTTLHATFYQGQLSQMRDAHFFRIVSARALISLVSVEQVRRVARVAHVEYLVLCFGWLPNGDGNLLIVQP